jgi:hypothetical protein
MNMSVLSHVSVGTTTEKFPDMLKCYDAFMKELGAKRIVVVTTDGTHLSDVASATDSTNFAGVGYGKYFPEFWVQLPHDKNDAPASPGNGTHVAFACKSADQVKRVYDAAILHGAKDNGKPGPRLEYSDKYYGAYFVDPVGNKMEASTYFQRGRAV